MLLYLLLSVFACGVVKRVIFSIQCYAIKLMLTSFEVHLFLKHAFCTVKLSLSLHRRNEVRERG